MECSNGCPNRVSHFLFLDRIAFRFSPPSRLFEVGERNRVANHIRLPNARLRKAPLQQLQPMSEEPGLRVGAPDCADMRMHRQQ